MPSEEQLRKEMENIQNYMNLINTNLPTLKNLADLETRTILNDIIPIYFTRHLFNKTRHSITNSVKSVNESTTEMIAKVETLNDYFLTKLVDTLKNVSEQVDIAVESVTDKALSVVTCVTVRMYLIH